MSTTNPLPPPPQSQDQEKIRQAQYRRLVSYTSLGALILCPVLIALPPRKLDIYTLALISGTAIGGNQVLRDYTGRSITELVPTLQGVLPSEHTTEIQERLKDGQVQGLLFNTAGNKEGLAGTHGTGTGPTTTAAARAVQEMKAAEEAQGLRDMGREAEGGVAPGRRKADWKAQRDAREKEALEDGRGYGGLIMDQIWEVWNWGRERPVEGEGDEKDVKGGRK
jgi:hypothetical protein